MSELFYSLDRNDYTCKNVLCWGIAFGHWEKAKTGTLGDRIVHIIICVVEAIPIVGQIASLFETVIVICCSSTEEKEDAEEIDLELPPLIVEIEIKEKEEKDDSAEIEALKKALITAPEDLLIPVILHENGYPEDSPSARMKDFPEIYECHCKPLMRRGRYDDFRKCMENKLIEGLTKHFPLSQSPSITICSIAAGGCFQELVLHAKLTELGYQVNWIVVDPVLYAENSTTSKTFQALVKKISPKSQVLPIYDYEAFFSEVEKSLKADIFLAFDSDLGREIVEKEVWEKQVGSRMITHHGVSFVHSLLKIKVLIANHLKNSRIFCYSYMNVHNWNSIDVEYYPAS